MSEAIQYPILAPSTQEITNEDDAYLRELFYDNKEVFKKLSLQDHKTSLEVVHRGLGDDRGNKHPSFFKKRKLLADRSEKVRRQRRDYFELLLNELADSGPMLGKRFAGEKAINALGVPDLRAAPSDLIERLSNKHLGNYEGTIGQAQAKIQALADENLFNNKRILDLGCGSGEFIMELNKAYKPIYLKGVDVDCKLIQSATLKVREMKEAIDN